MRCSRSRFSSLLHVSAAGAEALAQRLLWQSAPEQSALEQSALEQTLLEQNAQQP